MACSIDFTIVTNRFNEDVSWVLPLLNACAWVRIVIYDCSVRQMPAEILHHKRVEVRDKSGELAIAPFFYGVFDHCARECADASRGDSFVLFLHGHDTSFHQRLPIHVLLALCAKAVGLDPDLEYANLSDQLLPDWVTPGPLEWVARDGTRSPSMPIRLSNAWPTLRSLLGGADADSAPPRAIHEVHGAQALVARARIDARPSEAWAALRDHAAGLHLRSDGDYGLEAAFHRIFGEPWHRPFVRIHQESLLRGTPNELEIRCGCRYTSAPQTPPSLPSPLSPPSPPSSPPPSAPPPAPTPPTPPPALSSNAPTPRNLRIGLVGSTGTDPHKCPKCVVDSVVVVAPNHAAIAQTALHKLRRLKSKSLDRVQLTLKHAVGEHPAGTVLPLEGDLTSYLANDAVVAVSILSPPERPRASSSRQSANTSLAAACARAWREAALAASPWCEVPLQALDEVLVRDDVLVLLSARLSLQRFAPVCRAWRDATNHRDHDAREHDAVTDARERTRVVLEKCSRGSAVL